jgi:hypothetical protein
MENGRGCLGNDWKATIFYSYFNNCLCTLKGSYGVYMRVLVIYYC